MKTKKSLLDYSQALRLLENIGEEDVGASATIKLFRANKRFMLEILEAVCAELSSRRERMLDLGCGYGGLSKLISEVLYFKEVYGVDLDEQRLKLAKERGLHVFKCDLEKDRLPFPQDHFDLVTMFGVLEHLKFYDNSIAEARRVLKSNGLLLISIPNLGSWANRTALFLGYQPRDLEVSSCIIVGVHKMYNNVYRRILPVGHISGVTYRALKELLEFYGFMVTKCWGD